MLLYSYTGCTFFSLLPKPIFPYEMSFYQNPIKYCNMAIYCNTLKCNTQYGIDPYCFTPTSHHRIVSIGIFFSYNSFLFSLHILAWACILHLKFQSVLVSFISQSLCNRFKYNLYYCLPYSCSTSRAIFSLIYHLKLFQSILYTAE